MESRFVYTFYHLGCGDNSDLFYNGTNLEWWPTYVASAQHWFHRLEQFVKTRIEIWDSYILTTRCCCRLDSFLVFNPPLWQEKSNVRRLLRTMILSWLYADIINVYVNDKSTILIIFCFLWISEFTLYFSSRRGQYNKISSMIAISCWVAVSYHSYIVLLSMLSRVG